jgi:hypothetical protein
VRSDVSNPFIQYGRDSLVSLERRIRAGDTDPGDPDTFVDHAEIRRVIDANPGRPVPEAVRAALGKPSRRLPRGRRRVSGARMAIRQLREPFAVREYFRLLPRLELLHRHGRLDRVRRRWRLREEWDTPSLIAADVARRRFAPWLASPRSLLNRISQIRAELS